MLAGAYVCVCVELLLHFVLKVRLYYEMEHYLFITI